MTIAIVLLGPDGKVTSWSPGAETCFGYQSEEVLGRNFSMLYSPEDFNRGKTQTNLMAAIRDGYAIDEGWRISKDGSRFWADVVITALRDATGKLNGFLKTAHRTAEEKQANDELRDSERRERARAAELAAILDAVPTPVFIAHDPECLHITGNRCADELMQGSRGAEASLTAPEELKPRHFRAIKEGRELGTHELPAQMAARGFRVENFEFSLVFENGTTREVLSYGEPLWDEDGRPRRSITVLMDITDRKQAEKELQGRKAQLHAFVQHAPIAIAMFDRDMICLASSQRWTRDFGRGHGDIVGLNHYDVHPDLPEHWKETHRRGLAGASASAVEELWAQADGSRMWVSWAMQPWIDVDGKIGGIVILTEDVTARKNAEEALREEEAVARSIINSLTSHVALLDRRGRIVRVNLAWEEFARENGIHEMNKIGVGANYLDVCRNSIGEGFQDAAFAQKGIQAVLDGESSEFIMEYPCHSPTQYRWFLLSATPISSDQGGVVITHRNISNLKLAEKSLSEQTERLRSTLNTAADAIIVINGTGVIDSVNRATERLFGYLEGDMVGQNINMLMPPPYHDEHDGYLSRYLETGKARIIGYGREVIARRKDGSLIPVDLAISAIDHLGLFTGILRDISERKRLEKHLLEIADDEHRRIGQELHDGTQQELCGISLLAGTMLYILDQVPQERDADKSIWLLDKLDHQQLCQIAKQLCQRLSEANLHVRQLAHGIMPVQIDAAGLHSALEELVSSLNTLKGIECTFKYRAPVSIMNSNTATHLYRITQEAVNNAIRHGRADKIQISLDQRDGQICLEVRDNGAGFDPGDLTQNANYGESQGMGLRIMEYRAGIVGGTLRFQRGSEGGMCVKCEILIGS